MVKLDAEFCETKCPVCTGARKGNPVAKVLLKIEQFVTRGGCPACRARREKYGVEPGEPLPERGED